MSYSEFANKPVLSVGDLADPAQMNAAFDGLQDEFEARMSAWALDGVLAGMECSIAATGTEVQIASGQAYVSGKRFTGGASVGFSAADAAGTYYIYVDPADEASPYKKAAAQPGAGKLALCSVSWDGSALSGLEDLRPWGIVRACLRFSVAGAVSAGTVAVSVLDRDMWIERVDITLADTGSDGTTIVDVHIGDAGGEPASIFADQTRRPQLSSADPNFSVAQSGAPDTNRLAQAGQVMRVDVDSAATGASGLGVVIVARYV